LNSSSLEIDAEDLKENLSEEEILFEENKEKVK